MYNLYTTSYSTLILPHSLSTPFSHRFLLVHHVHVHVHTSFFSSSGQLALLVMAVLFCWQIQHKSLIGFITIMCGRSCRHSKVKVEYATGRINATVVACWYSSFMLCYSSGEEHQSSCSRELGQEGPLHVPL